MYLLAPLILATLIPLPEPSPLAQVARVKIGVNSTTRSLGVDWTGKSEDGKDHPFVITRIHLTYQNPALAAAKQVVIVDVTDVTVGTNKIPWTAALEGVPAGSWDLTARWEDELGQISAPSAVTPRSQFEVFVSNPSTPQNVGDVAK